MLCFAEFISQHNDYHESITILFYHKNIGELRISDTVNTFYCQEHMNLKVLI